MPPIASLRADFIAGLSVAGLMVPEAVAYAGIAGLPPARAIVAAIAGGLAYALIGRSRFAIVAPTSSSAAILAVAIASLPGGDAARPAMATALIAMAGLLFLAMSALRLGALAGFIARPVLRGFAFGLAVTIILKQVPALIGVPVPAPNIFALVGGIATAATHPHVATLSLGLAALTVLWLVARLTRWPGALVAVTLGVGLSFPIDLQGLGVALVGPIPLTIDAPALPELSFPLWSRLAQLALPLTLILFAESWGTMRALALRHGDPLTAGRELAALGAANLASALAQGMPVGAGFSAGSASEAARAATRLTGAIGALSVAAILLMAGPLVARIAEPVLAAIVIGALAHALSPAQLIHLFRIRRDQWIGLSAAAAVIGLGVLNGMLIAIALSVGVLLRRLAAPTISELGQIGDSHEHVDIARHPEAHRLANIGIFRPNAPLFFANADAAFGEIAARCAGRADILWAIVSLEESDDLDSSALEALLELRTRLTDRHVALRLARVHDRVREVLTLAGESDLAGSGNFSVANAVAAIRDSQEAAGDLTG